MRAGGATSRDLGFGRILGEVLVYLYLFDGECPLDRMEADLGLSKAAVSIAARQLESLGLARRVRRSGDRKRYYRTADELGAALREGVLALLRRKLDAVGLDLDQAQRQLDEAGPDRDPDLAFLAARVERARVVRRRVAGLMENPLARMLLRLR